MGYRTVLKNLLLAVVLDLPFGRDFAVSLAESMLDEATEKASVPLAVQVVLDARLQGGRDGSADELIQELLSGKWDISGQRPSRDLILITLLENSAKIYSRYDPTPPDRMARVLKSLSDKYRVSSPDSLEQISDQKLVQWADRTRRKIQAFCTRPSD